MFFQTIYGLLTESTEVGINIRRVNDRLTVAVMPRHRELKEGTADGGLIPLVASGTPEELDGGFAAMMAAPVAKAVGIMTNLKEFELQAEKAAAKARPKPAAEKETKEARETKEKNDKIDRLMKRVDESVSARRFGDAVALLKHAMTFAPAERLDAVKARMQEVRRKSEEGSLFTAQPSPAPQQSRQMPTQQSVQTVAPRQPVNVSARQEAGRQEAPHAYGPERDEECDMDAFRNDPYAEYVDFPQECRMRDEAQTEMTFA